MNVAQQKNNASPRWIALCILLCGYLPISAHDTWLLPQRFRVTPERPCLLGLTSAMQFPQAAFSIKQDRIEQATMSLAGERQQLTKFTAAKKELMLQVNPANVGVAGISINLKSRTLELSPKLVREYLAEIGASESLKNIWKNPPQGLKWRESYTKHSTTFLFVGEERFWVKDSSWAIPQGAKLEIVPEQHPGLLRNAKELAVRVLFDGKPLANFALSLVQGKKSVEQQRTDASGRVVFSLPTLFPQKNSKAAPMLVRGTLLQAASDTETLDWESHFATLTLER
ncbi:MAG: DUF4198 domain-containing protein [Candidatus Kapaibacterium sp.]|nr:MAG: DUF4198 domain-containing protein [Candidatus Kapabacteria bacterium]